MAGDWIKIRHALPRSGKVVRIMSACDADKLRTIGGLVSAILLFDEQTDDGFLDGYTLKTFDETIGMAGLGAALCNEKVGWMEENEDGLTLLEWDKHNGTSAKRRLNDAERKRVSRAQESCPQNVQKKTDISRTASGPEKRREEIEKREDVRYELSSSRTNCDDAHNEQDQIEATMKPEQPTNQTYGPQARAVLHMLNEVAGRNFRETDQNLKIIKMRLKEPGVEVQEIRKMIQRQRDMWAGTEFERYLRPETLFNATKFASYYDDRDQPIKRGRDAIRAQTEQHGWKDDKF
jgi:uncharacterized phage protein (TIGR02220 family)